MLDFVSRVRAARLARRWSQAQVAEAIGKSRPWVAYFEAGKIKRLSEADRAALTTVLDLGVKERRPLVTMDEETLEELLVKAAEMGADRALARRRAASSERPPLPS